MNVRFWGLFLFIPACCANLAAAPPAATTVITPLQAELLTDLHVRQLAPGSSLFAKVTVDWSGPNCILKHGSIVEAQVQAVTPHTAKNSPSEVSLAFVKAQCGRPEMMSIDLVLVAIAAPPDPSDYGSLNSDLPVTYGAGATSSSTTPGNSFRAVNGTNMEIVSEMQQFPMRESYRWGDVYGLRGLKLSVGTGLHHSSVLSYRDRDVALDKGTLILLAPAMNLFPALVAQPGAAQTAPSTLVGAAAAVGPVASAAVPPSDDASLCEPPTCNVSLPASEAESTSHPLASFSLRELGYSPRPDKELAAFDQEEALAYLGPNSLLVTFNPHVLVPRHGVTTGNSPVRVIRAALFEVNSHRIRRTVDWYLHDYRQYLWPLARNRVLVHVGSELRVYGEDLKLENRIPLEAPLAFVRIAPNGNLIVLGMLHERHTPELHKILQENLQHDPEEDVDILILNKDFTTIAKSSAPYGRLEPTLLNEGQLKLFSQPNLRYRLSMSTWDSKALTVAHVSSTCVPEVSSVAPDLIFLVSCNKTTDAREFLVLNASGKVLLRSEGDLNLFGQTAAGNDTAQEFVVKVVKADQPMPPGAIFRGSNLVSEDFGVYRTQDGKRRFTIRVSDPSPGKGDFALSPDGSQLAILTRNQIALYALPQN